MTISQTLFLICIFVLVYGLAQLLFNVWLDQTKIAKRTRSVMGSRASLSNTADDKNVLGQFVKIIEPVSKLSIPADGWENSPLQLKFVNAGIRSKEEQKVFFAVKTILALAMPALVVIALDTELINAQESNPLFLIFLAAAIGLYGPNFYLHKKVEIRKLEITNSLPDAMDLLIICMSAGLSFDNALTKVAKEIALKSEILSEEFELYLLEVRTGFTRERALRNLATRTGLDELDILATTIIQSEKFGTSLGDAMRIYATTARTKRRQKAEEAAGKIALKLLFPLLTCLMPATFIVLLAPAMMQLTDLLGN